MRDRLVEILDISSEASEDEIVRRIRGMKTAYTRSVEREELIDARFRALSNIAGPEATKQANDELPSEPQMKLLRMIDPSGSNFLGSGMTAAEFSMHRRLIDFERCISTQMNDESSRRLDIIIRIAVEYDRIRRINVQNCAALRSAMVDVIDGKESNDFDETIKWMLRFGNYEDQELDDREKKRVAEMYKLWAPAVAICREYTGIHKPPPEDRPRYESWQEMVEGEGGIFKAASWGRGEVWHDERDREMVESQYPRFWLPFLSQPDEFFERMFGMGVRWRGPRVADETGYWHREDGELFPYDRERFYGNDQFRFYQVRTLENWVHHQEK